MYIQFRIALYLVQAMFSKLKILNINAFKKHLIIFYHDCKTAPSYSTLHSSSIILFSFEIYIRNIGHASFDFTGNKYLKLFFILMYSREKKTQYAILNHEQIVLDTQIRCRSFYK